MPSDILMKPTGNSVRNINNLHAHSLNAETHLIKITGRTGKTFTGGSDSTFHKNTINTSLLLCITDVDFFFFKVSILT